MSRRRQGQGGFALLFVFLMAAGIAMLLYRELPRTAFESVRGKEELLVDHAAQYNRAIQLYVAKFQRYPQNLDDLEKTNNIRFLRRRFKDPFTGKDDWRQIHVDDAGRLTDSLIKPKTEQKPNLNTFITEVAAIGGGDADLGSNGVNVALRKRPSEGGTAEGGLAPLPPPSSSGEANPAFVEPVQGQIPNPMVDPGQGLPQGQGLPNG
ncbi:MAG: hypothetical protein H7039_24430, partial [Bryobacteraceae bacterium]|nr:hypothetical protein [Bryobacteraceae bacterium]